MKNVDAGIEAVTENEDLKKKIFKDLDQVVRPGGLLASNTSSIPITRIGASTKRPEAVIGMHFMNPVPIMTLVEIIRGAATSDETYAATKAMAEKMGKTTVVSKDFPGFIINRILIPMLNEACFVLAEGIATAEDIDTAMKLGTNVPMGPLTLADFIGLDTVLSIAEVLHKGLGDSKYRPCAAAAAVRRGGLAGQEVRPRLLQVLRGHHGLRQTRTRRRRRGHHHRPAQGAQRAQQAGPLGALRGDRPGGGSSKTMRALIVTGGGEKAFVAGADIAEMAGLSAGRGARPSRSWATACSTRSSTCRFR